MFTRVRLQVYPINATASSVAANVWEQIKSIAKPVF